MPGAGACMEHASGLGAAIEAELGLEVDFTVGHDAIFQITFREGLLYTNGSRCGVLPEAEEILSRIRERLAAQSSE